MNVNYGKKTIKETVIYSFCFCFFSIFFLLSVEIDLRVLRNLYENHEKDKLGLLGESRGRQIQKSECFYLWIGRGKFFKWLVFPSWLRSMKKKHWETNTFYLNSKTFFLFEHMGWRREGYSMETNTFYLNSKTFFLFEHMGWRREGYSMY